MGSSKSRLQAKIDAQTQALQVLNVSKTLTGILQQLERLERVIEGSNVSTSVKCNPHGDANHTTIETNQAALSLKLVCLNGILDSYQDNSWRVDCARSIESWYQDRQGRCSPMVIEAVLDSVNACQGIYQRRLTSPTTPLKPAELTQCSQGLVLACEDFHVQEEKVKTAPEAFLAKVQKNKKKVKAKVPNFDMAQFIGTLENDLTSSRAKMTQKMGFETGDSQYEDPVPQMPRSLEVHISAPQNSDQ